MAEKIIVLEVGVGTKEGGTIKDQLDWESFEGDLNRSGVSSRMLEEHYEYDPSDLNRFVSL